MTNVQFVSPAALLGLAEDMIGKDWQPVWCPQRQSGSFSPEPGCTGGAPWMTVLGQPSVAHKLAFRPPEDVLVLDVDHYGDKTGMNTVDRAVAWLGELPDTYRVTSRGSANPSGRYLFRKPPDLMVTDSSLYQFADPDTGKTDVEIVRTGHRFSWAPGDIHYKNNELIRCFDLDGDECDLPCVSDLPYLPERWVSYFRNPPVPQAHEVYTRPSDGAEWWLSQADSSLGSDAELASFAYNMLLSRVPVEEIWEQWQRVAVEVNPAWPWERNDFNRHVGSRAVYKADTILQRQDEEAGWFTGAPGPDGVIEATLARQREQGEAAQRIAEHRERKIVEVTQYQQNFPVIPLGDEDEEEGSQYFAPAEASVIDVAALIRGTPEYDRQYRSILARMQAEKDVAKVLARDFTDYELFHELPPPPRPEMLVVTAKESEGTRVIAPRTVTVLSGHRASGKTWVAAAWSAQVLRAGGHVIWIDFERQNRLLREKFTSLEIPSHMLERQFHYTGGMPPIGRLKSDVGKWSDGGRQVLVVVDAFRGLQSLVAPGTSANDGDAVENVYLEVLNVIVSAARATGSATVAVIDHLAKTGVGGTFGSERKESAADYVIKVEQQKVFSRTAAGFSSLEITKDRYGHFSAGDMAGYLWMPSKDKAGSGKSIEEYPYVPELRSWSPADMEAERQAELSQKGTREAVITTLVQEQPFKLSINKLAADLLAGYAEHFTSESTAKRAIREMIAGGKLVKDQGNGRLGLPEVKEVEVTVTGQPEGMISFADKLHPEDHEDSGE